MARVFGAPKLENDPKVQVKESLQCPICQESMTTLRQLNQHIDDSHGPGMDTSLKTPRAKPEPSEESIKKSHWKTYKPDMKCHHEKCPKILGPRNGIVHCRCCGNIFCSAHTKYRMRLDSNADHSTSGSWARVCVDCFTGREGYNDLSGSSRDQTQLFKQLRRKHVDSLALHRNQLEYRLFKLIDSLKHHGKLPWSQAQA